MKVTIYAFIGIPESNLARAIFFDLEYEAESTTILDLKYHLLAHARTQLGKESKKYFVVPQDIGTLFDKAEPETKYQDDELIADCIRKNTAQTSPFFKLGLQAANKLTSKSTTNPMLCLQNEVPTQQEANQPPPAKRQKIAEVADSSTIFFATTAQSAEQVTQPPKNATAAHLNK